MAESMNVQSVTIPVDSTTAGTIPVWKCPEYGGGITILEAFMVGSGTVTKAVYSMSNLGTPAVNGTLIASAAATVTAGVPLELTIADGFVESGEWIGWAMSAGTALAGSHFQFTYVHGK